ncbi:hypothetical protein KAI32_03815 [Candidatus Pacearchaeota archaeon]|nr:hypothetical protein [Candidatus Pacearchaeota archaeon]
MTNILKNQIIRWYKETPRNKKQLKIETYENNERLYTSLIDLRLHKKEFSDKKLIERIAKETFDIPVSYEQRGDLDWAIHFDKDNIPEGISRDYFDYIRKYHGHLIEVPLPLTFPTMNFCTGNRGNAVLIPRQRENYLKFLQNTYHAFLENAKNLKSLYLLKHL